jgi:ATP-dependent Lon protease
VAKIKQVAQLPAGVVRVLCEGLYRARAREIGVQDGYFYAVADEIAAAEAEATETTEATEADAESTENEATENAAETTEPAPTESAPTDAATPAP